MNNYILMRKNQPVAACAFDDMGNLIRHQVFSDAYDLAPLGYRKDTAWLKKWWSERSIPINQSGIEKLLRQKGYVTSEEYLFKNLGLSLTDYYWICPADSDLTWEMVNLFDNPFHENILIEKQTESDNGIPHYSPNGSLQGGIEKTWTIIDGQRYMIKGNHSILSSESINEVFASEIHKKQGYDNYVSYRLIEIKDKPYKYGCVSKLITSQSSEMVSAYALITSEKRPNNSSVYEFLLDLCCKYGADKEKLRHDLEYQIMTDFIITNYDRHLNNISLLRNADDLRITGMAPIYDSGASLFAERQFPKNIDELEKVEINSFYSTELKLLGLVKDKNCVDLTKLPSVSELKKLYEIDEYCSPNRIAGVLKWYERKIDICRSIQLNKDIHPSYFVVIKSADPLHKLTVEIIQELIDLCKNGESAKIVEAKVKDLIRFCDENGIDDVIDKMIELDKENVIPDDVYRKIENTDDLDR